MDSSRNSKFTYWTVQEIVSAFSGEFKKQLVHLVYSLRNNKATYLTVQETVH